MVRKHYHITRLRQTRKRPKTPAPKTGWVISELSKLTEIPVRRIRYYVEHSLIRPLEIRGTATRYQRTELLRLLAISRIRTEKTWKLDALKRELERLGEDELERLVLASPLPPAAAAALGVTPSAVPSTTHDLMGNVRWGLARENSNSIEPFPGLAESVETWHHVELLPGLKLLVSSKASSAVRSVAKKIWDEFLG
jgi:DNA-binding transcriptional MerR regulator